MSRHKPLPERVQKRFFQWALENGVNITNAEHYKKWWKCWLNGYNTGIEFAIGMVQRDDNTM